MAVRKGHGEEVINLPSVVVAQPLSLLPVLFQHVPIDTFLGKLGLAS